MGLKLPVLNEPAQLQTWTVLVTLILRQHGKHYFMIFDDSPTSSFAKERKDPDTYTALLTAIQPVFGLLLADGGWDYNKSNLHQLWRAIQTILPKHIDAGPKTTPLLNYIVHRGSVVLSSDSPYHVFNDTRYFDSLETVHLASPSPSADAGGSGSLASVPAVGGIARFQAAVTGGKTHNWMFQAIYDEHSQYSKISLGQLHIGGKYLDGLTNAIKNRGASQVLAEIRWVNNVAVLQLAETPFSKLPAIDAGVASSSGGESSSLLRVGTEPPPYEQVLDSKKG